MADTSRAVGVHDLAYLARVLPLVAPEARRQLSKAQKAIAELVAEKARGNASGRGRQAASAAETIRTQGLATGAQISIGDLAHPWTLGSEFGAAHDQPRQRSTGEYLGLNQFPARNPSGYWFFPGIDSSRGEIGTRGAAAVDTAWNTVVGED